MSELKERALAKMLDEMNQKHTPVEDVIHNWLCNQEDEKLLAGILRDGRTIKGAVKYMAALARKNLEGNMAVVDDATGYSWIREYFESDEIKESTDLDYKVKTTETKPAVASKPVSQKRKKKASDREDDGQLSLFDVL